MWLLEVDNIVFEYYGKSYNVKDVKDIPTYNNTVIVPISPNALLDEIATKPEIFGEGMEDSSYRLFEANAPAIVDENFSLEYIKSVRVPI